jgi:hypothetical protein
MPQFPPQPVDDVDRLSTEGGLVNGSSKHLGLVAHGIGMIVSRLNPVGNGGVVMTRNTTWD